jgi:urate oxidase
MSIVLGDNRYGKAETRLLRVTRSDDRHEIRDLCVSITLAGDFEAVHILGDNTNVLPTDTQKNTVYAFAKEAPVGEIEDFALRLARHFVRTCEPVRQARVQVEEYPWAHVQVDGAPHPHSFVRTSAERRLTTVTCDSEDAAAVSGLADLVVLRSAGSEFWGFARDRYTALEETHDRILATAVSAQWRFSTLDVRWAESFIEARQALLEGFALHRSLSLQQTLFQMARAVLEARPEITEVHLEMPNKHHFAVDLAPFGLTNDNEVFYAADRPYGLIEATVRRIAAET